MPFDELRFGPQRTLNLRDGLPTGEEAAARADRWLREQQVRGAKEVLLITGRGSHSFGGIAVVRPAVEKLLFSLRRQGVIASHAEHNPGAFVVRLAPVRALLAAAPRRREALRPQRPVAIHGIGADALDILRQVAERSLDALGVVPDEDRVVDEMHRYLRAIVPSLISGPGSPPQDAQLREALLGALAEFD